MHEHCPCCNISHKLFFQQLLDRGWNVLQLLHLHQLQQLFRSYYHEVFALFLLLKVCIACLVGQTICLCLVRFSCYIYISEQQHFFLLCLSYYYACSFICSNELVTHHFYFVCMPPSWFRRLYCICGNRTCFPNFMVRSLHSKNGDLCHIRCRVM